MVELKRDRTPAGRVTMALTIMLADGSGAHPGRPTRETCGVWSDPPDRRPLAGHQEKPNPTGSTTRPVCPELWVAPPMRLDSTSRTPFSTLGIAVIRAGRASVTPSTSRLRAVWHDRPLNGPQNRYSAIAS